MSEWWEPPRRYKREASPEYHARDPLTPGRCCDPLNGWPCNGTCLEVDPDETN